MRFCTCVQDKRPTEACALLYGKLAARPCDKLHYQLGAALHQLGSMKDAVLHFQAALGLNPSNELAQKVHPKDTEIWQLLYLAAFIESPAQVMFIFSLAGSLRPCEWCLVWQELGECEAELKQRQGKHREPRASKDHPELKCQSESAQTVPKPRRQGPRNQR